MCLHAGPKVKSSVKWTLNSCAKHPSDNISDIPFFVLFTVRFVQMFLGRNLLKKERRGVARNNDRFLGYITTFVLLQKLQELTDPLSTTTFFCVLTSAIMKMTSFGDTTPYSLVDVYRRFGTLMMRVVITSQTSFYFFETTQRHIHKGCYRRHCFNIPVHVMRSAAEFVTNLRLNFISWLLMLY
jgi:hypothetical protein